MEKLTGVDIWIRPTAEPEDLAWCAQLMTQNEPWVTLKRSYEASLAILQDPLAEVFLLAENGTRAGFIMLKLKGPFTGYIQNIAIDAPFRGKGIGAAAMAFAEQYIFRFSPNVFICVSDFNEGARRLYERQGYQPVGWLKDYVVAGHDELLLRKTIGPVQGYNKQATAD